jgi:hypothetical protein
VGAASVAIDFGAGMSDFCATQPSFVLRDDLLSLVLCCTVLVFERIRIDARGG